MPDINWSTAIESCPHDMPLWCSEMIWGAVRPSETLWDVLDKAHNHQTLFTIDFFLKWAQVGKSHSPIVWPCQTLLLWNYIPKTDTWRSGAVSIRPLLDMFAIFQTFKPERQISKQTYSTTLPSGEFMKLISRQIATVEKQSRNLQYSSEIILGYPWFVSMDVFL